MASSRSMRCALLVSLAAIVPVSRAGAVELPRRSSWESSLISPGDSAAALVIEGRVIGEDGRPLRNARMHAYHAGPDGQYTARGSSRYLYSGVLRTNVLGQFRFRTILPGMAEGNPHVHFEVELPGGKCRGTQINLARSAGAGSDTHYAKLPWMVTLSDRDHWAYVEADTNGFHCSWDLRLAKTVEVPRPAAFGPR